MEEPNLYQPPKAETDMLLMRKAEATGPNTFYAVSPTKLTVLSLTTLNLYSVYWMYKQWQTIRDTAERPRDISPFWRAVFSLFFIHELFRTVRMSTSSADIPTSSSSGSLATTWLIISLVGGGISRADGPLGLVGMFLGFFAIIPLVSVQKEINAYLRKMNPAADLNERFSGANVIVMILGTLFLGLAVLGTLQPS